MREQEQKALASHVIERVKEKLKDAKVVRLFLSIFFTRLNNFIY
jgi:hypothetical protein